MIQWGRPAQKHPEHLVLRVSSFQRWEVPLLLTTKPRGVQEAVGGDVFCGDGTETQEG